MQALFTNFSKTTQQDSNISATSVLRSAGPQRPTAPPLPRLTWTQAPGQQPPTALPWHVLCSPQLTHRQVANLSLTELVQPMPWTPSAGRRPAQQLSNVPPMMSSEVRRSRLPPVYMARCCVSVCAVTGSSQNFAHIITQNR